ncbi:hypothetical protein M2271_000993 [Streptomyces sp. LBL]|uniref:MqnA/MqnD/SBP family protein n=1 Tax=Streptomyces sp. LBL TaxID=2940562 RepID=UPI002473CFCB|nr:MqnA/MqnD/SBP family protein [Streptomyces sp. LBL]MDH6623206.1 hypothetical protein [Streptomyces sp. LBL]
MPRVARAAVVIGDDAPRLQADVPHGLAVHDTRAMRRSWTGLPTVLAVRAVRREFEQAHVVREVRSVLLDAVGRARPHPVVVAGATRESRSGRTPSGCPYCSITTGLSTTRSGNTGRKRSGSSPHCRRLR